MGGSQKTEEKDNQENTKLARRPCHRQVNSPEASKPVEGLPAVNLAGYEDTKEEGGAFVLGLWF
jgi:hypothetical protein